MAVVVGIFINYEKGKPMQSLDSVRAIAHLGLAGDRYALGLGSYSDVLNKRIKTENLHHEHPLRHVTLMSQCAFDDANNKVLSIPFQKNETRRNLFIDHVSASDLLGLIDQEFMIGNVRMRGFEDCTPCHLPAKMVAKTGFKDAFTLCGGLRAEILTSGIISLGDELQITP